MIVCSILSESQLRAPQTWCFNFKTHFGSFCEKEILLRVRIRLLLLLLLLLLMMAVTCIPAALGPCL